MNLAARSNIANKIRNTHLPRTKPLMPLFEVISNSIHAIAEARKAKQLTGNGEVKIRIIRNGDPATLAQLKEIDEYPIKSFEVVDNGIGLNDENLNFFIETDTDHKIEIGGKGVGRFICLKAFQFMKVESCFSNGDGKVFREFEFRNTKEGFHSPREEKPASNGRAIGTKVILTNYKEEYQKHVAHALRDVAREIILHFQLYFIQGNAPKITLENQNKDFVDLQTVFGQDFQSDIESKEFTVAGHNLKLFLSKSFKAQSHKLFYCAHNREVISEGLAKKIVDLGKYSVKFEGGNFYYQAFVVGDVLDQYVGHERIGFIFPADDDEDDDEPSLAFVDEITLSKIRKEAINAIEEILKTYLDVVRQKKFESYQPVVKDELPQYRSIFLNRQDQVKKLQPNLTKNKLDIELYKIEADWRVEIKEQGSKLLEEEKDISNLEEYKQRYEKFLSDFNEIGKTDLARYVVHRKTVIELLEHMLNLNGEDKFSNEDLIHNIFFPIRTTSDEVAHDKQNLWLLDERLTYHDFLASDKLLKSVKGVEVNSADRTDLLIYNNAFIFSESQKAPHNSFTIVEFKKPQRNDYKDYNEEMNPIEQSEKYVEQILSGKVKDRNGRFIAVDQRMPFFVYIVCEVTPTLEPILKRREFDRTPDGQGWYLFKTKHYNGYFEIVPYEKVLADAKKRNRILFDKLGLGT
jgi:hypothetical protein